MTEFLIGYLLGIFTAITMMLTIIYWAEIKARLVDIKERLAVKWILWKYRSWSRHN